VSGADPGVVVTGVGVVCATARDVGSFVGALRAGTSGVRERGNADAGADPALRPRYVADLDGFSLAESVAALTDLPSTVRRDALRAASRAPLAIGASVAVALEGWQDAGLHRSPVAVDRIGLVVAGHNLSGGYAEQVRARYTVSPVHLPARFSLHFMDTDHVATVSQVLGIRGEGYTVGGASASGNVAILNGHRLVASGAVDVCLVLGALTELSAMELQGFYNLGAMAGTRGAAAAHERCRPFDADREGFVAGQGAACLVLESADSARDRGVPGWGRVVGAALRLDGNALADPSVAGEALAMAAAIRHAGLEPAQIGYVNAHGTGSTLGDEVELAALHQVFGTLRPWVNSTKGLVGHCLCAAGVVEAVACLVQLRDGFVHPNANLRRPIDAGCRLAGERAVPVDFGYALSNGFGFGGFNTSVVFGGPARDE
jgi:malonyl-ACP decarboxylase